MKVPLVDLKALLEVLAKDETFVCRVDEDEFECAKWYCLLCNAKCGAWFDVPGVSYREYADRADLKHDPDCPTLKSKRILQGLT